MRSHVTIWGEHSRWREQQMQRSWGSNEFGVFEEQKGSTGAGVL